MIQASKCVPLLLRESENFGNELCGSPGNEDFRAAGGEISKVVISVEA